MMSGPVLFDKNVPCAAVIDFANCFRKYVGRRPFVFVLTSEKTSHSTAVRAGRVEPNKTSNSVFFNFLLHFCDDSARHGSVGGPFLMTFAVFMFFPVFAFSAVSADTRP